MDSIKLLNLIYQNAQMGLIGIDTVLPKIENGKITKLINEQKVEYENICKLAIKHLKRYGAKEEELSKLKEISTKMMSEAMTIAASDEKIVKLMMSGNERGVIEIQENLNKYTGEDEEIKELALKLIATEEHNCDEFKPYL